MEYLMLKLTDKQSVQFAEIDSLPDSTLVETNVVLKLTGTSRVTLAIWLRKDKFPKPICISGCTTSKKLWRLGELRKALGLKRAAQELTQ